MNVIDDVYKEIFDEVAPKMARGIDIDESKKTSNEMKKVYNEIFDEMEPDVIGEEDLNVRKYASRKLELSDIAKLKNIEKNNLQLINYFESKDSFYLNEFLNDIKMLFDTFKENPNLEFSLRNKFTVAFIKKYDKLFKILRITSWTVLSSISIVGLMSIISIIAVLASSIKKDKEKNKRKSKKK
jgi:hypothetical protein